MAVDSTSIGDKEDPLVMEEFIQMPSSDDDSDNEGCKESESMTSTADEDNHDEEHKADEDKKSNEHKEIKEEMNLLQTPQKNAHDDDIYKTPDRNEYISEEEDEESNDKLEMTKGEDEPDYNAIFEKLRSKHRPKSPLSPSTPPIETLPQELDDFEKTFSRFGFLWTVLQRVVKNHIKLPSRRSRTLLQCVFEWTIRLFEALFLLIICCLLVVLERVFANSFFDRMMQRWYRGLSQVNRFTPHIFSKSPLDYKNLLMSDSESCSIDISLLMIRLSALVYEDEKFISKTLTKWGLCFERVNANPYSFAYLIWTEKWITIVFKGTSAFNLREWWLCLNTTKMSAETLPGKVHSGFYRETDHVYEKLRLRIEHITREDHLRGLTSAQHRHVMKSPRSKHIFRQISSSTRPIWLTGHSLGGAKATLTFARLLFDDSARDLNVRGCYTFGAPRVGNKTFSVSFNRLMKSRKAFLHRICNANDIVPYLPHGDVHSTDESLDFSHVGHLLVTTRRHCFYNHELTWYQRLIDYLQCKYSCFMMFFSWRTYFRQTFYSILSAIFLPVFLEDHLPSQYINQMAKCYVKHQFVN